jgi:hypothetical protein
LKSNLSRFREWAKNLRQAMFGAPRRTEITIETDELFVIRRQGIGAERPEYGREVELAGLREAEPLPGTIHSAPERTSTAESMPHAHGDEPL